MSKLVNVKIDGQEYRVPEGVNIVDAADSVGIHIPNLCYLKGMKGIGACRMCLVEINGRTTTACIMKTKEGMEIVTENEKINEVRKFVIDLILSMHPLDCMTCTKAGVCQLQKYAYDFEIKESSFSRKKFGFPIDEANPFIKRDPDYCILCARCVRVCKEQGTNVLDFHGRGVGSRVITANDNPLQESGCTFCGSCVDACPVNALLEADRWRKGREWEYESIQSVCTLCGSACDVGVNTFHGEVAKINAGADDFLAEHYICAIGRYGFDALRAETRILSPMVRHGGELRNVSWKDALQLVSKKLKETSADVVTSGSILNEDALTLLNFAKVASLKSVVSTVGIYADKESLIGQPADIDTADVILLAGVNPSQWKRTLPALDATIRKKVSRGTKLIVINNDDTPLAAIAHVSLVSDEALTMKNFAKALQDEGLKIPEGMDLEGASVSEALKESAELFSKAKRPLVVSSPSLFEAAGNIALIKGSAVSVALEANAKGTVLMGIEPNAKLYQDILSGGSKILYVIGNVPFNERPDVGFLIVQATHMTDLAKNADVVLPASDSLESEGSLVDYLGRLKEVRQVVSPAGDSLQHKDIIANVSKEMGLNIKTAKTSDAKKLSKVKAKPSLSKFTKKEGLDVSLEEFVQSVNTPIINGSRLFWLKETEKAIAV